MLLAFYRIFYSRSWKLILDNDQLNKQLLTLKKELETIKAGGARARGDGDKMDPNQQVRDMWEIRMVNFLNFDKLYKNHGKCSLLYHHICELYN